MITETDILIVGGGHAGAAAAAALRQRRIEGRIVVLSAEPDLPYERPPLSKEYLAGEKPFDRLLIRPQKFWQERDIQFRLGERAVRVDAHKRTVATDKDAHIQYKDMIWATGGAPRLLPVDGADLQNVFSIRTREDVDSLASALGTKRHIAIVGGGYIGLEAAAVARKLGHDVTLLEMADRVLSRVTGPDLSRFFEDEHRRHGVDLRLGTTVERMEGGTSVKRLHLSDGTSLPADLVIVGIGVVPQVLPLLDAGARGGNGVWVDERCRTSLPHIFAIGDCALHANQYAGGEEIRLESVQNANDQAQVVAKNLAGQDVPYQSIPWFWSDQYDLKLQTVGISTGCDETIVRGDIASRSFAIVYIKDERILALDCVNDAASYMAGRMIIQKGGEVDLAALREGSNPLKALIG